MGPHKHANTEITLLRLLLFHLGHWVLNLPVDEGTTPSDTIIDYNKVSSFQINLSSRFENKLLPYDLIIVRNHGDDDKDVGGSLQAWWTSKGSQAELEAQSKSSLSLLRSPGTARTKINAQAAY